MRTVLRVRLPGVVSIVLAACAVTACGPAPQRAVLGEWTNGAGRMTFYPDGELYLTRDSTTSVARYQFVARDRVRVTDLAAAPAEYRVRVSRDSLVMCRTDAASGCWSLARVAAGR
jgi:hypothetical protein